MLVPKMALHERASAFEQYNKGTIKSNICNQACLSLVNRKTKLRNNAAFPVIQLIAGQHHLFQSLKIKFLTYLSLSYDINAYGPVWMQKL